MKCSHCSFSGRLARRYFGKFLDRRPTQIGLLLQDAGDVGVAARHFDHACHFDDRSNVRFLDRTLHDARQFIGLGCDARWCEENPGAVFLLLPSRTLMVPSWLIVMLRSLGWKVIGPDSPIT